MNAELMQRIQVENLHKDFRIYQRPQDRLIEALLRRPRHTLYHVLSDISFGVVSGHSLGIIGDNGAGKSTLLKLMVGTLQPTSGQIFIEGQVAALLELGAGFHPEFTGRRNIHLNAALLGVPDNDIHELEQGIIDFSELDEFIDRPVKTYSSGMYVRLAFSIATMVRPDVLIIDEALSVGDMAFQKKCVTRMNEFREQRKTMVFCSHSMYHVQQLCDNAIWIDKGRIREMGESEKIVGLYEDYCNSKRTYHSIVEDIADGKTPAAKPAIKECRIVSFTVKDESGEEVTDVIPLSDLYLRMEVEILTDHFNGNFGFAFMNSTDEVMASFLTTNRKDVDKGPFKEGDRLVVSATIASIAMRVGQFYILSGIADHSGLLWQETKPSKPMQIKVNRGVGSYTMKSDWNVQREKPESTRQASRA
ncbi:MAG: ABC transporter ATP-binding protein [Pseudohongiellaceae bacterium]